MLPLNLFLEINIDSKEGESFDIKYKSPDISDIIAWSSVRVIFLNLKSLRGENIFSNWKLSNDNRYNPLTLVRMYKNSLLAE